MLKLFKIARLFLHLLFGVVLIVVHAFLFRRNASNPLFQQAVQHWYHKACHLVGLQIKVQGMVAKGPVLLVANHISWLDIPLMASLCNPRFLSKSEVRRWPLIGWAAEKLNTLFIVRGKRTAAEAVSGAIAEGLEQGDRILIFPEGTTTTGENVGFLYPRLFGAAIATESWVQPVVIHYQDSNSHGHSSERVPYIGDQTLLGNLWALLGSQDLVAHVYYLEPVDSADAARKALAMNIQNSMQQCLAQSQAHH